MKFNLKQAKNSLIGILIVFTVTLFLYGSRIFDSNISTTRRNDTDRYKDNWIKINQYLYNLYIECGNGRLHVAQNTFLDIQQLWQYQDVLAGIIHRDDRDMRYFPSDSLSKLENYLENLRRNPDKKSTLEVIREISRINEQIDSGGTILRKITNGKLCYGGAGPHRGL